MAEEQSQNKIIPIQVSSGILMLVAVAAGFLSGLMMVLLDPWLRFADVPIAINWLEAALNACLIGGYASILAWTISSFWRSKGIWMAAVVISPILAGVVTLWNNINAAFGFRSDFLILLPAMLILHLVMVGSTVAYLNIALWFPWRRSMAYTAIPIMVVVMIFLFVGQLRWNDQDAKDVVFAVDQYAHGAVQGEYKIQYQGIRYSDEVAPFGDARIHSDSGTLACRVRIFPSGLDVNCRSEEE